MIHDGNLSDQKKAIGEYLEHQLKYPTTNERLKNHKSRYVSVNDNRDVTAHLTIPKFDSYHQCWDSPAQVYLFTIAYYRNSTDTTGIYDLPAKTLLFRIGAKQ